jgi:hypothetical protein
MSQAVLKGGKSGAGLSIFGEKAKRPANLRNRRRVAKPNKIDMQGGPKVRALKQKDVVMSSGKVNLSDAIPAMSLVQKSISTATCGQMRVFLRESDVFAQSLWMRTDFVAHVTVLLCCAENCAQKRQPPWQPHLTALAPQADQGFSLRSLLEERIAWIEKVGAHNNICQCKTFLTAMFSAVRSVKQKKVKSSTCSILYPMYDIRARLGDIQKIMLQHSDLGARRNMS